MKEEICDNCNKTDHLTVIDYATSRNKQRLVLCEDCFGNFRMLIEQLATG